jgi:hypothetical protein
MLQYLCTSYIYRLEINIFSNSCNNFVLYLFVYVHVKIIIGSYFLSQVDLFL